MTNPVDAVFEREIVKEDSVDIMIGSGFGDLIDIVNDCAKGSIFDADKEELC